MQKVLTSFYLQFGFLIRLQCARFLLLGACMPAHMQNAGWASQDWINPGVAAVVGAASTCANLSTAVGDV